MNELSDKEYIALKQQELDVAYKLISESRLVNERNEKLFTVALDLFVRAGIPSSAHVKQDISRMFAVAELFLQEYYKRIGEQP